MKVEKDFEKTYFGVTYNYEKLYKCVKIWDSNGFIEQQISNICGGEKLEKLIEEAKSLQAIVEQNSGEVDEAILKEFREKLLEVKSYLTHEKRNLSRAATVGVGILHTQD